MHYEDLVLNKDLLMQEYLALIEGGQSDFLLDAIQFDDKAQALDLLLNASPFLSIEVAEKLLALKDTKYLESEITQIFMLNPEILRRNTIYEQVFNLEEWSADNLNLLKNSLSMDSERSLKILDIANLENEILSYRKLISKEMLLSEQVNYDFLTYWYGADHKFDNDLKKLKNYFVNNKIDEGLEFLNNMSSTNPRIIDEINLLRQLKNLETSALGQESIDYRSMNALQLSELESITLNSHYNAGLQAIGILEFYFNYHLHEETEEFETEQPIPDFRYSSKSNKRKEIIFPNPANNNISVNLQNIKKCQQINIYSNQGKQLKSFNVIEQIGLVNLDISFLSTGLYYVEILSDKGAARTEKIIILR